MRTVVIGSTGQLGTDLLRSFADQDCVGLTHDQLEITDEAAVHKVICELRPDIVVNTAAFHNVPLCEVEREAAHRGNVLGPKYLASACRENNSALFHISTDYVFRGDKGAPYSESDAPDPINVYGVTKLAGERAAQTEWDRTYIIRTCGLFGATPCRAKNGGRNFVQAMLHLAATKPVIEVVNDQQCCPTYTRDLAEQIRHMASEQPPAGVYHAVNEPGLTWFCFAKRIFSLAKVNVEVIGVSSAKWDDGVARPADSRLRNDALRSEGVYKMRTIESSLHDYLADCH